MDDRRVAGFRMGGRVWTATLRVRGALVRLATHRLTPPNAVEGEILIDTLQELEGVIEILTMARDHIRQNRLVDMNEEWQRIGEDWLFKRRDALTAGPGDLTKEE